MNMASPFCMETVAPHALDSWCSETLSIFRSRPLSKETSHHSKKHVMCFSNLENLEASIHDLPYLIRWWC